MARIFASLAVLVAMASTSPKMSEKKMVPGEFSFPPNNTPVARVFVFGKPIYVRQPFLQPLRDQPSVKRQAYGEPAPYSPPADPGYGEAPPAPKYPLPGCYTNAAGFMCCNKELEQLMDEVYDNLNKGDWKSCNTQQIANALQNACQEKFGTDFEAITGVGDFASKAHFYSDLICKTEKGGRTMLAYATPNRHNAPQGYEETAPPAPAGPYHTVRI